MEIKAGNLFDELRMLRGVEPITNGQGPKAAVGGVSFSDLLEQKLGEVNQLGLEADKKIQEAIEGRSENPHETQIAIQKADVAFKLMLSVKEQIEQAYQTVMRSSIG
jgi:flagellar hook-basal body complex protein FliE